MKRRTITLVLATLNEIEGVKHVVPEIDRSLFKEIIVVDGRSTDGTVDFCMEQGFTVLIQPGVGLPDAYEYGYAHCTGDAIVTFTPDGNCLPKLLAQVCEKINEGYDMVVVSRYLGGARSYDDDKVTALGNRLFTFLANFHFGSRISDSLGGFRAYTREAMELLGLPRLSQEHWLRKRYWLMKSWEYAATLRAGRLGLKVAEIPGDEPRRVGGTRKMKVIRNGIGLVVQLINDFLLFRGPAATWRRSSHGL